jgi:hypothetical protein
VSIEQLSRSEAIAAIQHELGDTEEAAHVIDWTNDMWDTMTELYKRLPSELADKIIHVRIPTFDKEIFELVEVKPGVVSRGVY